MVISSTRPRSRGLLILVLLLGASAGACVAGSGAAPEHTGTRASALSPIAAPSKIATFEAGALGVVTPVALGSAVFFSAGASSTPGSYAAQLWKTDGTMAGTGVVTTIANNGIRNIGPLVVVGSKLYFPAVAFGVTGPELFTSDGTAAGSVLAADVPPTTVASFPVSLTVGGSNLFFGANSPDQFGPRQNPYVYTPAGGAVQIHSSLRIAGSEPRDFVAVGSGLYFTGQPQNFVRELLFNDGIGGTTSLVSNSGNSGVIGPAAAAGNVLYFVKSDTTNGAELWKTVGGGAATLVRDVVAGTVGSLPDNLTAIGNTLYFVAASDVNNLDRELYKTDGTDAGTVLVKDLNTLNGGLAGSYPHRLGAFGSKLVFAADDGTGDKWFITDGTAAGTSKLGDVPAGTCGPIEAGTVVVVCGNDTTLGNELWTSDGTPASLVNLADLSPGAPSSNPEALIVHAGKLIFSAFEGSSRNLYAAVVATPVPDAGTPVPDAGTSGTSGGTSGASGTSGGTSGASGGTSGTNDAPDAAVPGSAEGGESGCTASPRNPSPAPTGLLLLVALIALRTRRSSGAARRAT